MTLRGWLTFLISTGAFTTLFSWCIWKVLTSSKKAEDKMVGMSDINAEFDEKIERENSKR